MHALLIGLATVVLGGCASADPVATARESPSVREYPTGSNIPRRSADPRADGITVHSREDLERLQQGGYNAPSAGAGSPR